MVFQDWLFCVITSHLSYTFDQGCHCEAIVKRGSRYTIRAGRYLCDKEFRYLRTVRVTAAVYRGFHSKLITLLLPTFQHRAVHREDRPPNSKFFPGSFNLVDYDNSRDYKQTRDYGRAGDRARPSQKGFDDSSKVHIRERRVRGRGGSPRPDHPIHSNRQAWFCSQSNFVTFVYPSDGSPFGVGASLGTDSLCVD
ncbi:hypothetical protein VNO78_24370 [Psophocarpus tetragonolobus]|uniref:Uncharacterized protein n=1 Tax=Psophocarpus tetragonolobus TaxID=3891 RepID=A0AAN9XEL7_PSOTE